MADEVSRRAARWATLVALPVALLSGVLIFALLTAGGGDRGSAPGTAAASPDTRATGPVAMAAPRLDERAAVVCRALLSDLPDRVRDLPRRPVTAGPEQNAAFGDPPITVACGVPAVAVGRTDLLLGMDGVCWHPAETPVRTVWTTVDRGTPVRVVVPSAYAQPAQWANEFSAAVVAAIPPAATMPLGCS